uniref:Ig-like domain-containing protein n=1 Tax=Pygocentrus nattereri TaxID=42514 RepID=A0A3B4D1G5_PYGNA
MCSLEPVLDCIPSLRVPRNTVWKSPEKETLKINCTVTTESHCWKNVSVSWCKIEDTDHCRPLNHSNHTGTGWRNITEKERKFFLIFWSLSLQDAGLYRCKSDGPVFTTSHVINVTVTGKDIIVICYIFINMCVKTEALTLISSLIIYHFSCHKC